MPSGVTHILLFVHLGIILILVLRFYSGLSGRVRTVCLFSLCVVSLLSSRFTASALVWFSNFLKYLVFYKYIYSGIGPFFFFFRRTLEFQLCIFICSKMLRF
jgi:hypothetical protein